VAKRQKTKIVPPIKSQKAQEKAYQKQLMKLGRAMAAAVRLELMPFLKQSSLAYTIDSLADDLGRIFNNLNKTFGGVATAGFANITSEEMVKRVSINNAKKFDRTVQRATGIDIGQVIQTEGLMNFKELSVSRNVSLIKDLPAQYLTQIETIVNNGVASGARYSEIAKQIMSKTGANDKLKNRIKTIARNEVQTINSQLTLRRSESLGIKKGIYRTSKDERVRQCHKELDGVEYDLKKGAWSKTCQKFIQPGITDINCRCSYSPVIETGEMEDVPKKVAPKKVVAPKKALPKSVALKKNLRSIESKIAGNKTESLHAFTPDGKKLFTLQGTERSVGIPIVDAKKLKGNIMTHNHPGGTSFSPEDIGLLNKYKMKEIRAVGKEYTHTAKIKKIVGEGTISSEYDKTRSTVIKQFQDAITDGKMTVAEANANVQHVTWSLVSKNNDWLDYGRSKR